MKKEAPQTGASYFSHGLREAVFLFAALHEFSTGPFSVASLRRTIMSLIGVTTDIGRHGYRMRRS